MTKQAGQIKVPIGYEIIEEPKRLRRTFALKPSVFEEFKAIATRKGTNVNALINDLLVDYVNEESEINE